MQTQSSMPYASEGLEMAFYICNLCESLERGSYRYSRRLYFLFTDFLLKHKWIPSETFSPNIRYNEELFRPVGE